jgi:creatinine amidohydrolase
MRFLPLLPFCFGVIWAQQSPATRDMAAINWMEFREWVPAKIQTVFLPTGTLEPHGVANNGADITAPLAIAQKLAESAHAMIAPVIPYGVTGSLDAYPGAFTISEPAYRAYVGDVLGGLGRQGFRNIIVLGTLQRCVGDASGRRPEHGRPILFRRPSFCINRGRATLNSIRGKQTSISLQWSRRSAGWSPKRSRNGIGQVCESSVTQASGRAEAGQRPASADADSGR